MSGFEIKYQGFITKLFVPYNLSSKGVMSAKKWMPGETVHYII